MKIVFELRGSMANIERDTSELKFHNIQTCCAVVINNGNNLIGFHLTLSDRARLDSIANRVLSIKGEDELCSIYFIGALKYYDQTALLTAFEKISNNIFRYDTTRVGFVDIHAVRSRGLSVEFKLKVSTDSNGHYWPVQAHNIHPMKEI